MSVEAVRAERKALRLCVRRRMQDIDRFVIDFAANVSRTGMFVRTCMPAPIGSLILFEIQLEGGRIAMRGRGSVRWVRQVPNLRGPSGMGIRFEALDPPSRALLERMLARSPPPPRAATNPAAEIDLDEGLDEPTGASAGPEIEIDLDA